ncbi:glycosyltransferase family 2 protein [Corynebacterium variabile]|uniref:glycosyltransferase family 2 protein n=1 Tax=Corynebacterium variabile TaxID=1727 RepID=UPI003FD21357
MAPHVSIIIPVYNTLPYISATMESIIAQEYTDFEAILIDDGSTDGSSNVCDQYAKSDDRIRVIHKENSGAASSRNIGIQQSAGEFILFVDADDLIAPDMLSGMVGAMSPAEDLAVCGFQNFVDPEDIPSRDPRSATAYPTKIISPSETLIDMMYERLLTSSPWAKLFRRRLFEGIEFPDITTAEDLAIMYRLISRASSVARVDAPYYHYRLRPGSAIHSSFTPERTQGLVHSKRAVNAMADQFPNAEKAAVNRYFMEAVYILQNMTLRNAFNNRGSYLQCKEAINSSRSTVLHDRQACSRHRIYAAVSYLACWPLALSGDFLLLRQQIHWSRS